MLPTITKIIFVFTIIAWLNEIFGYTQFPSGKINQFVVKRVFIGNPNLINFSRFRVGDTKRMEMGVEPAHRILYGNVQIPKAVGRGNYNPAPNGWLDFF